MNDAFFKQLVESAGDVIYVCDMTGRCTYVNTTVQRLFGWSPDEVIGHRFTEFIHSDWRSDVEAFYIRQFQERVPETILEFPALTRDGGTRWVEQVVFLQIEGDWVTGFYGYVRDASRRKQAEDQLRAIIDAVPDHIYVKDCEHRFILVNRATWKNEGFKSADAMLGLTDVDLYGDAGREDWDMEERLLQTGEPIFNYERENTKVTDERYREVVLINKVPLYDENGAIMGLIGINRDITERKLSERQLLDSQNMLQTIIDSSPDLIFIKDKNLRYKMFNPAGERTMGIPVEKIIGKTDTELFNASVGQEMGRIDNEVMQTQEPASYEISRHIGGEEHWFHINKVPFVDDEGEVAGVVGFGQDITEHREAQTKLAESEERYRAVVDGQTDLICRFNTDLMLTFVNEAYCRYFDKTREELIGNSFLSLIPAAEHEGVRRKIAEMMEDPTPRAYMHRAITASGEVRWQEWTDRAMFDQDGKVNEFQSVGRDITERKQAEEESAEYIQQLEILQMVDTELNQTLNFERVQKTALDAAVRLSRAHAGAIHLVDKDELRVAQVIGDYPAEMVGVRYPLHWGIVGRVMRTQEPERVLDVTKDKNYVGNVPGMEAQITVPLTSQEHQIGTLNVQTSRAEMFTDKTFDFIKLLSARIAAALDNARLYEETSGLDQLKTQLIHVAAHDIRGPLGVVSGYVQVMADDPRTGLTEHGLKHLGMIEQAAERINKITQDILTMERVERMQQGSNLETIDLADVVRMVYQEFTPQADAKALNYTLDTVETSFIKADRVFLRETVVNLINNAIRYTPQGGSIRLRLKTKNGHAYFEVEDTGYGIPAEKQSELFKPFYRVMTPETREIKGTGLGLHLVKNIVERHGGEMIFHSVYGQGSTFGFKLPRNLNKAKKPNGKAATK